MVKNKKRLITIALAIILVLASIWIYRFWEKQKLLSVVKPIAEQYIKINYSLNYKNADESFKEEKKLWLSDIKTNTKYVKDIQYESQLIKYEYKNVEIKDNSYIANNYKGAVLRYEVSFKENSTVIDKNLKNTTRVDIIDMYCAYDNAKIIGE